MDKLTALSLIVTVTGLSILYFYPQPQYQSKTPKEIEQECEGKVKAKGKIIKSFTSQKQNKIGILKGDKGGTILVFLEENRLPGKNLVLKGKASEYREQCFLFPDKIKEV